MNYLIIINEAPYGNEKAYNALRIAMQLQKDFNDAKINIFLMADAVNCAIPNQNTPNGYYNIERMFKSVSLKGGEVKICGSCAEARGLKNVTFINGAKLSNMTELAQWISQADKILNY